MTKARIRSPLAVSIALGGALFATAATAGHPLNVPAPGAAPAAAPAADGGLGTAVVAARVQTDATLLAGSGATGTVKLGTGTYEVDFNRNVSGCFYNAVSFTNTVAEFVEPRGGNVNGVFLFFTTLGSTSGNPAAQDSQFYLTVYCGN